MKTPREVLLQRHQSVTPRLDAIRQQVVGDLASPAAHETARPIAVSFLQEFLLPLRWHLAGMSALWLLAALLSIDQTSTSTQTATATPPPQVLAAALSENRRQLAEMINSPVDDAATVTPAPQPFLPRRRSALQPTAIAV